jgi:hypothetical protein
MEVTAGYCKEDGSTVYGRTSISAPTGCSGTNWAEFDAIGFDYLFESVTSNSHVVLHAATGGGEGSVNITDKCSGETIVDPYNGPTSC